MPELTAIRPHDVCDPAEIKCPRCASVLRRLTVGEGSNVAHCEGRIQSPTHSRFSDACGQHIYVAGGQGFALVFPITREEHDYLTATGLARPALVLATLGVLRSRDRDHVPERECSECHKKRKTFDLYKGICRWCHEPKEATA